MIPPPTIEIKSDGNILEFRNKIKTMFVYEYIKSITKKGMFLELTEQELTKLIKINTP